MKRPHVTQAPTMGGPDLYAHFATRLVVDETSTFVLTPSAALARRQQLFREAMAADYARAQAADAPAALRDWFWEAVRRGCSDPDLT